jgi:HK97 family phage portal protein
LGFRDWFRGAQTKDIQPESKSVLSDELVQYSPGLVQAVRLWGNLGMDYGQVYRSSSPVYIVVEFHAWQISQIGLQVFQRASDNDRVSQDGSPLARLFDEPAPGLTYEALMHGTVADLDIYGNAYWLKMEQGPERFIVPLPPLKVTPIGGNLIQSSTYRLQTTTGQQEFDSSRIVHFRRYNPVDPRIGVSPLEPLRAILAEDAAATAHRRGFWENFARLEGVLTSPTGLSDVAYERLRTDWQNLYSGADNAGKTAILEEGTDFKAISVTPKDAEFIEGRKQVLETVARAYNIPVSLLGLTDTATFASQEAFHTQLYVDTLGPWLKMLAGRIQREVVPWFTDDPDIYVEFNVEEKLRGSFDQQANAVRALGGVPIFSVNELRARYNMPRIDDPEFDTPVKPANVIYGLVGTPGEPTTPDIRAADVIDIATKEISHEA